MPYHTLKDLPDNVTNVLPKHAQEIYRAAFNNAWDEYKDPDERRGHASREETPFKEAVLQPDGAVGVNCFDIANYFCPINGVCVDFAFLEGFLVVKSPVPLDIVGVYTARHTDGDVESIDVEAVAPRQVRETVRIGAAESAKQGGGKRVDYPPKGSSAYGEKEPKQMCGGIAGFPCPEGKKCVDDPSDNCDPARGGADCSGICVKQ